jgi:hypothetical protein
MENTYHGGEMPGSPLYWRGWTEKQLASYQQDQRDSNHCAKFAAASSLNMLYGTMLQGEMLVSWLNARPLKGTGWYTILGNNNGSLVFQTANLVNKLAQFQEFNAKVFLRRSTQKRLVGYLKDGNTLSLVSITYFQDHEPLISRGENTHNALGAARVVGGHLMILGAYDPSHANHRGEITPWGFVSSWSSQEQLYWMKELDFQKAWGRLSLFNTIHVQRQD